MHIQDTQMSLIILNVFAAGSRAYHVKWMKIRIVVSTPTRLLYHSITIYNFISIIHYFEVRIHLLSVFDDTNCITIVTIIHSIEMIKT